MGLWSRVWLGDRGRFYLHGLTRHCALKYLTSNSHSCIYSHHLGLGIPLTVNIPQRKEHPGGRLCLISWKCNRLEYQVHTSLLDIVLAVNYGSIASSGLYASFLKGQGHQDIFSLVKGTLLDNCKFLLEHFKDVKVNDQGAWRQLPLLPPDQAWLHGQTWNYYIPWTTFSVQQAVVSLVF